MEAVETAVGADPEGAGVVLEDGADEIAGEAVGGGEGGEGLLAEDGEAGVVGAEPHVALAVLEDGEDVGDGQRRLRRRLRGLRRGGGDEAVEAATGGDPDGFGAVLKDSEYAGGGLVWDGVEAPVGVLGEAGGGADPERAVGLREQRGDVGGGRGVQQERRMGVAEECEAGVAADPEIALRS